MNITAEMVAQIRAIAERFGALLVVQFGSTVRGTTHAESDLDLAVQFEVYDGRAFERVQEMQAALQSVLPGRRVDLAILNHADPLFLRTVVESSRLVYGAAADFARLRLRAFKRYQDFLPYLAMERRYVTSRVASLRGEKRPT